MSVFTWKHDPAQSWRDDADCRYSEPAWWDPDIATDDELRRGKAICDDCPVRVECLADAVAQEEKSTVRGGIYFGDGVSRIDLPRARPPRMEPTPIRQRVHEQCPGCGREVLIAKNGRRLKHAVKAQRASKANRHDGEIQWCERSGEQVYTRER